MPPNIKRHLYAVDLLMPCSREVWNLYACLGLLENPHDLAVSEPRFAHVEPHVLVRLKNSTYYLDNFFGGYRTKGRMPVLITHQRHREGIPRIHYLFIQRFINLRSFISFFSDLQRLYSITQDSLPTGIPKKNNLLSNPSIKSMRLSE